MGTGTTEKKLYVYVNACVCMRVHDFIHENDHRISAVKVTTKEHNIRYQLIWRMEMRCRSGA